MPSKIHYIFIYYLNEEIDCSPKIMERSKKFAVLCAVIIIVKKERKIGNQLTETK